MREQNLKKYACFLIFRQEELAGSNQGGTECGTADYNRKDTECPQCRFVRVLGFRVGNLQPKKVPGQQPQHRKSQGCGEHQQEYGRCKPARETDPKKE